MTNHIPRTESEILLCEDEAFAELRDDRMYNRIVNGISRRQECKARSLDYLYETSECLSNIMRTRRVNPDDAESLHSRRMKAWKSITGQQTEAAEESPNAPEIVAQANSFLGPTMLRVGDNEEDQMFPLDP